MSARLAAMRQSAAMPPVPAADRRQLGARRRATRDRGATSAPATCCCSVRGLAKSLRGVQRAGRRRRRRAARRDPGPARAQRLGQVDLHQRGQRALRGRRRQRRLRGARASTGVPAHRHRARRHRAHLPDPAAVRAPERARQRRAGRDVRRRRAPTRRRRAARRCSGWTSPASHGKAERCPDELNLHQRKFLELARALASRPRLVLLDEVLCGLTPAEIDDAVALIRRIRDQGSTIVFVEHVMRRGDGADRSVVVFDHGELLAEGAAAEVMQRPEVMTRLPAAVAAGLRRSAGGAPMLEVRDLEVAYGAAPALWGVSLSCGRRAAVRGRSERRGQDHAGQRARRHPARARRPHRVRRPRHHAPGAPSLLRGRHRAGARGAAPVHRHDGAREPRARQLPARARRRSGASRSTRCSRCSRRSRPSSPAPPANCRAASSRWWRSLAR